MGDQGRQRPRRRGTAVAAGIVVACGALGAVGAAGAAQQAAEVPIGTSASEFVPDTQQINTGDTVVWQMSMAFHNVKADTGPAEDTTWAAFHTTPKSSGEERRTFGVPGTYTYHCEVHPGTMTGTLEVVGAPVETPTPTPSATATATPPPAATPTPAPTTAAPDDHTTTPAPAGTAAADRTAPAFSRVGLKGRRHAVRVRFRLSETSAVTLRIRPRGSRRVLRTVRVQLRPGLRSVTLRSAKLRRGRRYTVELRARDPFGNRSATRRAVVRVRGR